MSTYDTSDELAASLQTAGVDCTVIEDEFIKVPIPEIDRTATLKLEGGWVVFKMFVGQWGDELDQSTLRSLLLAISVFLASGFVGRAESFGCRRSFQLMF